MKSNHTLSALFNVAFGTEVLSQAVLAGKEAVTRPEAMTALVAGYLAADSGYTVAKVFSMKDHWIDLASDLLDLKRTERTKNQQSAYAKASAKYFYYFGDGASSKEGKAAASKVWDAIVSDLKGIKALPQTKQRAFEKELAELVAKYA
jgi:hypothetical protein